MFAMPKISHIRLYLINYVNTVVRNMYELFLRLPRISLYVHTLMESTSEFEEGNGSSVILYYLRYIDKLLIFNEFLHVSR